MIIRESGVMISGKFCKRCSCSVQIVVTIHKCGEVIGMILTGYHGYEILLTLVCKHCRCDFKMNQIRKNMKGSEKVLWRL